MKVIDLLNKIAKGEEVPKKIKWNDDEYSYVNDTCKNYANDYEDFMSVVDGACLNDEIKIIEEKKIEELKIEQIENGTGNFYIRNEYGTKCCLTKHSKIMADKINELVRELNEIKKEGVK